MIDPSMFEKYMTPQQSDAFRTLKENTRGIRAQIIISSDNVEIKLVAGSPEAVQYLSQIATSIGTVLNLMWGITGEIVKRS